MNDVLAWTAVSLNAVANALGGVLLAPLGGLPGWLSLTIVSAISGILLLVVFKHVSNQVAIKRVRDQMSANLLALKLFKESALVSLRAQGCILIGAMHLFGLAVVPILVMALPVTLLFGQLALWYQARPLRVGEETIVTITLRGTLDRPAASLRPNDAVEVLAGPVRVQSKHEVCWSIRARRPGAHVLSFNVDDREATKQIAIGDGLMKVSLLRPDWDWLAILANSAERPFRPASPVRSIEIAYSDRLSWTSGTDSWIVYWFVVSMVVSLSVRRRLNVFV